MAFCVTKEQECTNIKLIGDKQTAIYIAMKMLSLPYHHLSIYLTFPYELCKIDNYQLSKI